MRSGALSCMLGELGLAVPGPGVRNHVVDPGPLRPPAERGVRRRRIGDEARRIAGPARANYRGNRAPGRGLGGGNERADRMALTVPEVEDAEMGGVEKVQRVDMAASYVG